MTKKILYWHGIIVDPKVLEEYRETIEAVYRGDHAKVCFEKLNGAKKVYSARDDRETRILFTTLEGQDGKPYLIVLDVVLKHRYDKSRFLKPMGITHFMELNAEELASLVINESSFLPLDEPLPFSEQDASVIFQGVDFINHQFMIPNPLQEEAIQATPPLVVTGAPGSGKSCVALALLSQYVEHLTLEEKHKTALYVTSSKRLAKKMRLEWVNFPCSLEGFHVEFKTFDDLITEVPGIDNLEVVNLEYFEHWLQDYVRRFNRLKRTNKEEQGMIHGFLKDIKLSYQTFRLMNGCKNKESFFALGESETAFNTKERAWLFTAYENYQSHLTSAKKYHGDLFQFPEGFRRFDFTVVDEVSNLSYGQLRALAYQSESMVCCGDIKQTLFDRQSKLNFLKELFKEVYGKLPTHVQLPFSYRCSIPVVEQANRILQVENSLAEGVLDKTEAIDIKAFHDKKGEVRWINPQASTFEQELQYFLQLALTPDFAIITDYKEEAKALFKTPLVFSPLEAQGLEFKHVLLYRPLDKPIFKEASKALLSFGDAPLTRHPHLPKKGRGQQNFITAFNEIFTAMTRSQENLYIVQQSRHDIDALLKRTLSDLEEKPNLMPEKTAPIFDKALEKRWERQIGELKEENLEQAADASRMLHERLAKERSKPIATSTKPTVKKASLPMAQKGKPVTLSKPAAKASVGSQPKKIVSSGLTDFANKLFENLSETNLEKAQAHKSFNKIIFEVPLSNGKLFIDNIFNNPCKFSIFSTFFSKGLRTDGKKFLGAQWKEVSEKIMESDYPSVEGTPIAFNNLDLDIIYKWTKKDSKGYLVELLKNFKETTLISFLLSPTSNDLLALKLDDGASFLDHIKRDPVKHQIYVTLLKKEPSLNERIAPNQLKKCSQAEEIVLIKQYLSREQTLNLVNEHLKTFPEKAKLITIEMLRDFHEEYDGQSILYALCKSGKGFFILKKLFKYNIELCNKITKEDLCHLYFEKNGTCSNVLFFLCGFNLATTVLENLVSSNRSLLNEIPLEEWNRTHHWGNYSSTPLIALCGKYPPHVCGMWLIDNPERLTIDLVRSMCLAKTKNLYDPLGYSGLLLFLRTKEGKEYFIKWLEMKPEIAMAITGVDLYTIYTKKDDTINGCSIFYELTRSGIGFTILKKLFKYNLSLCHEITTEDLCHLYSDRDGRKSNALFSMCTFFEATDVLSILLSANHTLLNEISLEEWNRIHSYHSNSKSHSALLGLCAKNPPNALGMWLINNPEKLTVELMQSICKALYQHDGASFGGLDLFIFTPIGQEYFKKWLELEPEIALVIQNEYFYRPYTTKDVLRKESFPLHLSKTETGRKLLKSLLLINPALRKIPLEVLFPNLTAENWKPSLFTVFSTGEDGPAFLQLLDYSLCDPEAFAKHLLAPDGVKNKTQEDDNSTLSFLIYNGVNGANVLLNIVKTAPSILAMINFEEWNLIDPSTNHLKFHRLASTISGVEILTILFKTRPEFIEKIDDAHLCVPLKTVSEEAPTLLGLLMSSPLSRNLLLYLLEKKPDLFNKIDVNCLLDPIYPYEQSKKPAYFFLDTPEGERIFGYFPQSLKDDLKQAKLTLKSSSIGAMKFFSTSSEKKQEALPAPAADNPTPL